MQLLIRLLLVGTTLIAILACDRAESGIATPAKDQPASSPEPAKAPEVESLPRVVFLGDSLTAGYGVETTEAFPSLIEQQLASDGLPATVINAGVSGDTTAGGLRRLGWILRQKPDVLVVCLGGNDGLRNLDVAASKENLRRIITDAKAAGAQVLLLGMMIPTNYGPEYGKQFEAMFPALAQETDVPLIPFALKGVGGVAELNQADGIHPTARGHQVIASNIVGPLRELLQKEQANEH